MWAWKVAPALAAGCCIVMKPSELTPLSALYMCQLVKEAGIPAGVFNTVPGLGATTGDAISRHMDIDKVKSTHTSALLSQRSGLNLGMLYEGCTSPVHREGPADPMPGRFHRIGNDGKKNIHRGSRVQPEESHPRARRKVAFADLRVGECRRGGGLVGSGNMVQLGPRLYGR